MKQRSVETKPLAEKSVRQKIYEGLSLLNPLSYKPVRKAIYTAAVVLAVAQGTEGVDKSSIQRAFAKGMPAVESVEESFEATKDYASELVEKTTPIVEKFQSEVQENILEITGNIEIPTYVPYEASSNSPVQIVPTQSINQELQVSVDRLEESSNNKTKAISPNLTPSVTPAPFGKEVTQEIFRQELHEELFVSLDRPFNTKEANDIFEDLGLSVSDLINSDLTQKEGARYANFSDPNIPSMAMFPSQVMRWAPLVEKLNSKYNNQEKLGFQTTGNSEFLSLIYVESYGYDCKEPNYAGAVSPAQVTFYAIDDLAPGDSFQKRFNFARIPENGIEIGYIWHLKNKKMNDSKFVDRGMSDPLLKNTINFMTYNGGSHYSFIIAEGGVDSIRHLTDELQIQKYGIMNRNLYNNYQVFLEAYKKGYRVTYKDSLNPDNDLEMFRSDLISKLLEEARAKKAKTDGSYESMRQVLDETILEYQNKSIFLQDIKISEEGNVGGSLDDINLPPAVLAVTKFYNN